MTNRQHKLALLAWVAVCVIWGTTYLAIRVALESVPVALLAGLRWTTAGALMAIALRLLGHPFPPPRTWPSIAVVAFLMTAVGNGLVVWAEQYVASGLAAVLVAMVPFWSVFIEAGLGRSERITRRTIVGLVLGFGGIVVLVWPELTMENGRGFVAGVVALQLACAGWALGTSFTKRQSQSSNPLTSAAAQMLFGGIILLAIGTAAGEWPQLTFTTRTATAMVYMSLIGSIVGYTSYVYALSHLPVSFVSLYAYVNPIIAVILGALLLSEPFGFRLLFASGLVFAGIYVVRSNSGLRAQGPGPRAVQGPRPDYSTEP